jgi:predicted ATP-dependent endonuclease of OLD family
MHCSYENFAELLKDGNKRIIANFARSTLTIYNHGKKAYTNTWDADYKGSILSSVKESVALAHNPLLNVIKNQLLQMWSVELISPRLIKSRARESGEFIGSGGERVAANIASMSDTTKKELIKDLQRFNNRIIDLKVKSLRAGWKRLELHERVHKYNQNHTVVTHDKHISDGMIRLIAILTQLHISRSVMLFDEVEDGIHPSLLYPLVESLYNHKAQVIITTHSAMLLNLLTDEQAKTCMIYFSKDEAGNTQAERFFDINDNHELLTIMGPGEAYLNQEVVI